MQRKAMKQLGKVTQWTNEKVFSGEKTQFSSEFTDLERDVDPKRLAIERLHATSMAMYRQWTKAKPTADPYPPSGTAKNKVLHTEALGLVMVDVGSEIRGTWGDGLQKYGKARCKLAAAQEDFTARIGETYIGGMESGIEVVNDYKTFRKKLDSRRLTLDAAITKAQNAKKDVRALEFEVDLARGRFEEIEQEAHSRLISVEQQEEMQWAELSELLEAELEYFTRCKEIVEELRDQWPQGSVTTTTRPRAKSNASARSAGKEKNRSFGRSSRVASDDEDDDPTPNRSRSQSNASTTKGEKRRSMLPSFGSFRKGGLSNLSGSLGAASGMRKSFGRDRGGDRDRDRDRDRYEDESRRALHSDEDPDELPSPSSYGDRRTRSRLSFAASGVSLASENGIRDMPTPPPIRRANTTPLHANARLVKAIFDFTPTSHDELALRIGDIVEVKEQVSTDWYIGECDGHSGMFPATYCEEYVPTPVTARPTPGRTLPPPSSFDRPVNRNIPPPEPLQVPASPMDLLGHEMSSDSEVGTYDRPDRDEASSRQAALFAQYIQPQPVQSTSRPPPLVKPVAKKSAPPPPPPSRRSKSSSNILSSMNDFGGSAPAFNAAQFRTSPEGSPFAHSEDEDEIFGGSGHTNGTAPSLHPIAMSDDSSIDSEILGNQTAAMETTKPPAPVRSMSNGLGALHLGGQSHGDGGDHGPCKECSCEDFTQNVFKGKGMCSTCYHQH